MQRENNSYVGTNCLCCGEALTDYFAAPWLCLRCYSMARPKSSIVVTLQNIAVELEGRRYGREGMVGGVQKQMKRGGLL